MADFQINPVGPSTGQIEFTFGGFTKEDGSPGEVEAGTGAWALAPQLGDVVMAADGLSVKVRHNGGAGEATLSATVDGDLGVGEAMFSDSVTIEFMAPVGATAGEVSAGTEGPVG